MSDAPVTVRGRQRSRVLTAAMTCGIALLATLSGCEGGEGVVLYVSADEYVAREVVAAFEQQTGIDVQLVGDTEAQKTTGLVQRLRAEQDNPQADVFWSSEIFQTIALAEEGVLAPYESPATAGWPARFRDDEGRWYAFAARARVIVFDPERLPEDERPRTWMELIQPRFRGQVVMADPRFGTTGGHLAAMRIYWERMLPGAYGAFLEGLAANDVRLLPGGNAAVVDAVARGEALVGMTDTDDVWAAQANGLNVALIYPAHHYEPETPGGGTLLIPNTVGRVADGPNPDAAAALIDFLLSPQVELMLAESVSHNIPLHADVPEPLAQYAVDNPLDVNFVAVARAYPEAVEQAMRILTAEPEPEPARSRELESVRDDATGAMDAPATQPAEGATPDDADDAP